MTQRLVACFLTLIVGAGGALIVPAQADTGLADPTLAPALAAAAPNGAATLRGTGAARLNVSPLRLDLGPAKNNGQLFIQNYSDRTIPIEARVFAWTQVKGKDRYIEAADATVSPSIVRIGMGKTQVLHVIVAAPPPDGVQRAYRVVIDQLPDDQASPPGTSVTRLRLTLPLFTGTAQAVPAHLQFMVAGPTIIISNSGARAMRLDAIALMQQDRSVDLANTIGVRYMLAGTSVTMPLPLGFDCRSNAMQLKGVADIAPFDVSPSQPCS